MALILFFFFANIVCLRHDAGVLLLGQRTEPLWMKHTGLVTIRPCGVGEEAPRCPNTASDRRSCSVRVFLCFSLRGSFGRAWIGTSTDVVISIVWFSSLARTY
jgi:hypothetical protein